jgi:uncharacterized membrane protein
MYSRKGKRKSTLNSAHVEWLLLLALAAAAAFLRFYRLGSESFWRDELIQATLAQNANGWWHTVLLTATKPGSAPLENSITYFIVQISQSETVLRIPAALFGVGSVLLLYFAGKKLFNTAVGFLAAMFLALSQLHIYYSQEMRVYSLATFMALLVFYLFIETISNNRKWYWIALTAAATLALYSHYYTLLLMGALGLWTLARRRDVVLRLILSFSTAVALFFPWIYYDIIREGTINSSIWEFEPTTIVNEILGGFSYGLGTPCDIQCIPLSWRAILLSAVLLLALVALFKSKGQTRGAILMTFLILAIGVPGTLLLDYVAQYFFAVRQMVIWLPYLMLLAASILVLLPERVTPYAVLVSLLLFAGIAAPTLRNMYTFQTKEDFRGAAVFLEENMAPNDIIFAKNPSFLTFYNPDLKEVIFSGPETPEAVQETLVSLSDNESNAWFILWGENPVAYERGWAGIRRRGEKVFDKPNIILIPPAPPQREIEQTRR